MRHSLSLKKPLVLLAAAALLLFGAGPGRAQDAGKTSGQSAEAQSDVLAYLDHTIDWYRSVQAMRLSPDSAQEAVILQTAQHDALKVLRHGFDYSFAEAAVLEPQDGDGTDTDADTAQSTGRLAAAQKATQDTVAAIHKQLAATDAALARAPGAAARNRLQQQRAALTGALNLTQAQVDLLKQVQGFLTSPKNNDQSFSGAIKSLQRSFPELKPGDGASPDAQGARQAASADGQAASTAKDESIAARSTSGIIAAITDFLPLWQRARQIDLLISQLDALEKQNDTLRTDLRTDLTAAAAQGRAMTAQSGVALPPGAPQSNTTQSGAPPPAASPDKHGAGDKPKPIQPPVPTPPPAPAAATAPVTPPAAAPVSGTPAATPPPMPSADDFDALTARFKLLSSAVVPLGEQHQAMETCRTELVQWRAVLTHEFASSLVRLLARLFFLTVLIVIPLAFSEVSRRAANRYVKDTRRRGQLRTVRRTIVGTIIGIVVCMSLFAEVGSLATYVGLLTAGVAVALQQVILSMFAYMFFFGRFGVRVGECVTLGGVTGEVIEAGLLRVYVMEYTDGRPSGRIAIFPNLVFFQPSAFFKQIADTNYAWQDQSLTFVGDVDQEAIRNTLLAAAAPVVASYSEGMKKQQTALESATGLRVAVPQPECVIQVTDAGQVATLRYPVEPGRTETISRQMSMAIKQTLAAKPELRLAETATPGSA